MIDHDVDIETDQLVEARQKLGEVLGIVGDVPALLEADERLVEAEHDIDDLEGFEDKLTAALRNVERAVELVVGYGEHVARLHQQGSLRISNDNYDAGIRLLVAAADAGNRWIDYAEKELRDVS